MDVLEYIKEKKGKRLPESFKAPKVYNILPYLGTDLITFVFPPKIILLTKGSFLAS